MDKSSKIFRTTDSSDLKHAPAVMKMIDAIPAIVFFP